MALALGTGDLSGRQRGGWTERGDGCRLQTATETAANALIGVPVSYTDLITLATNTTFLRRVQIAVAKFANYCLNEAIRCVEVDCQTVRRRRYD